MASPDARAHTRTLTTTTTIMTAVAPRPTHIRLPSPTPLLIYGSEPTTASTNDSAICTPQSARFFDWCPDVNALKSSFPRPPTAPPKTADPRWLTYVAYQLNHHGSKRDSIFHATLSDLSKKEGEDVPRVIRRYLRGVHANGRRSAVLDVGTGTGVWAHQIATEQEYSNVIGIEWVSLLVEDARG